MQGNAGVPTIHWFGVEGDYNCLIMGILGPNLEQLFDFCERQFTIATVLNLGL